MNSRNLNPPSGELVSALVDGQLGHDDVTAALQACRVDGASIHRWSSYHVIREVLSTPDQAGLPVTRGADLDFVNRFSQRLARESLTTVPLPAPAVVGPARGAAANDGTFRWKLVAGLASVAALSVIAWNTVALQQPAAGSQLAGLPPQQVVVDSPAGPMVRDARLEEMLAAHKEVGGMSALQVPSGFLRNATFETPRNVGR
ncbi:sigma-E factor negative regulatory protein [Polaromonas sp. YR568]|uniref:sigma-E factor negative regulatory protein n=1 Tax=Polaromonas sp. YR568 TaxID=1855301 RepID=UPI003137AC5A